MKTRFGLGGLVLVLALPACRRDSTEQVMPSADKVSPAPAAIASTSASATVVATAPIASAAPSASASSAAHGPVAIGAADEARAKKYVAGLSRGRKATAAKDYAAAIEHFNAALAAEPDDARALSERGYAHLLAEELDLAASDLEAAARRAPSSQLLQQILFNQAMVEEKRGNEAKAKTLRAQRAELAAAKKTRAGKDCDISIDRPGTLPMEVKTFREAWKAISTAHFAHWGISPEPMESPAIDDNASEETIRKTLLGNAATADGAYSITTEAGALRTGHMLFVRGKRILLHLDLGNYQAARCPFGDEAPEYIDGALPQIRVDGADLDLGYICNPPGKDEIVPCDQLTDGTPIQSYCYWTGSRFRTRVLDPRTLAILLDVTESTEARDTITFERGSSRAVVTVQPSSVLITGCGNERRESIP